ncbi:hypothetical protein HZC34_05685 [Candidatus Saganbacteria bacterium]|nr:hypothetical protein [Candidatus Saganbacteria bacterium]
MDIGKAFIDAWEVYKKNYIVLILSYLTFLILSVLTLGVLAIPLSVGFKMMYAKASRGQDIVFNDIFLQMKNFMPHGFNASNYIPSCYVLYFRSHNLCVPPGKQITNG